MSEEKQLYFKECIDNMNFTLEAINNSDIPADEIDNLEGRLYGEKAWPWKDKRLVSRNGLRSYRPPVYKVRVKQIQSNFQKRGSTAYKWNNNKRPGYYNGHLRVWR